MFMRVQALIAAMVSALVGVVMISGSANASLIGQDVTFECTNCGPPTNDTFTVTEGLGPELTLFNQFAIDVEAYSLKLEWLFNSSGVISGLNLVWSDLFSGVPGEIVGATVDGSSTWAVDVVPVFDANSVTFTNNGDSTVAVGDFILINLEVRNEIPAPLPLALIGLGLAGLGLARRRMTA